MAAKTRILEELSKMEDGAGTNGRIPPEWSWNGGDDLSPSWKPQRQPVLSNAKIGMTIFLGAEAIFFSALIAGFLYLRLNAAGWPPPSQPRLPVLVTGINTLFLLTSAYTMWGALRSIRGEDQAGLLKGLGFTVLLGGVFLAVQGYEWLRLISFGFTLSSGSYGTTFYTLIGLHGLHVFAAITWLLVVLMAARRKRFSAQDHLGVSICAMYWHFVVALWPVLYGLVYLV